METIRFKFEKATKNTFKFAEVNAQGNVADRDEQKVGSLYVQKSAFESQPAAIEVTITATS